MTDSERPSGDIKISLPFNQSPHLKNWPDVDITFARSIGDKVLKITADFPLQPETGSSNLEENGFWRDLRLGGTLTINLDNLGSSGLELQATRKVALIDKGPFEGAFTASLSGASLENATFSGGFCISFEPLIDVMSFNVNFEMFQVNKNGIEMLWGIPVWKWGESED